MYFDVKSYARDPSEPTELIMGQIPCKKDGHKLKQWE